MRRTIFAMTFLIVALALAAQAGGCADCTNDWENGMQIHYAPYNPTGNSTCGVDYCHPGARVASCIWMGHGFCVFVMNDGTELGLDEVTDRVASAASVDDLQALRSLASLEGC